MKIGDRVLVSALVKPEYVDENQRKLIREVFDKPKEMIYTGYTFRQEGRYQGGRHFSRSYLLGPFDYDPPYLSVEKTIRVLRVKEYERSNDKFALVEDVTVVEP